MAQRTGLRSSRLSVVRTGTLFLTGTSALPSPSVGQCRASGRRTHLERSRAQRRIPLWKWFAMLVIHLMGRRSSKEETWTTPSFTWNALTLESGRHLLTSLARRAKLVNHSLL